MDVIAHTLWTAALYRTINFYRRSKVKINVAAAAFWGVFPDLFAFTPIFLWLIVSLMRGTFSLASMPRPESGTVPTPQLPIFELTNTLYHFSHSIVIFLCVFVLVSLIFRRPVWTLGGWLLHILIDIPTHSAQFYPTPFLWPLSQVQVNGISWSEPWFMIINYSALVVIYILLHFKSKSMILEKSQKKKSNKRQKK